MQGDIDLEKVRKWKVQPYRSFSRSSIGLIEERQVKLGHVRIRLEFFYFPQFGQVALPKQVPLIDPSW
jgi:hypothetical protein